MEYILIMGDPHAHPDHNNRRFTAAGNFITDRKPKTIICMGDMEDMPSLSSFDKGKRSFEGRRYKKDVAAVHDALAKMADPIDRMNINLKKAHTKQYNPKLIMLGGNHGEGRQEKATQLSPELEGILSVNDYMYEEFGWEYIPFRDIYFVKDNKGEDAIGFSHYLTAGNFDKALATDNLGKAILDKKKFSAFEFLGNRQMPGLGIVRKFQEPAIHPLTRHEFFFPKRKSRRSYR